MSEPRLVSPLLDGFIIGEAISDHHGVRCCPAIRENTDERYIVKIISIPASQVQLDALLLSGAYTDQSEALAYFKELSDDVVGEADILDRLSHLEGFVPYLGQQIQQMDDGVGYDVYLIGHYKRSLEKLMRTEPLTHLGAVNLGLDMCAALAVSRRAGYLYADLKPGNIFLSDTQGYHIGDLGFIPFSSLKYASLPEKYRSSYTAPEITDAMSTLNDTIDIYALGLTLYQVYNNGELPFEGSAPAQQLPPPMYADYEMAEIILKACAPDPADRWQDPAQMGQALVNYMQRNSVNDTPIVPPPAVIEEAPEETEQFLTEEENDAELAELLAKIPDEVPPVQSPEATADEPVEPTDTEQPATETESSEQEPAENAAQATPELAEEGPAQDTAAEQNSDTVPAEQQTDEPQKEPDEEPVQLSFLDILTEDETTPSEENAASLQDTDVTDEVARMLAQADELISHELPEPVVAPAPIDIPIPPPIVLEPEVEEASQAHNDEQSSVISLSEAPEESVDEDPETSEEDPQSEDAAEEEDEPEEIWDDEDTPRKKASARRWIAAVVILLLLAGAALGGYFWYNKYYLQTVDSLEVRGTVDEITVLITTQIDEDLLTVVCTDTYGNTKRSPVHTGSAVFTGLNPNTQYRIHVEISGTHKLLGSTSGSYTTAARTEILNFSAINGPEDGSVILNFSVNGPENTDWTVEYSAPGIAVQTQDFAGHSVTITGLAVDSEYTFRLLPKTELYLSGTCELTYTARKVVYAQDLKITACGGGSMTVQWALPDGAESKNWIVRCYNDAGYDQTLTTAETSIEFTGLDHSTGYTVTVTAEGMTQSVSTTVTADPINVTGFTATVTDPWAMTLSWDFTGTAPKNGWILTYTMDGDTPVTVTCGDSSTTIALSPGCTYAFCVRPVDETTYFAVPYTYGPAEYETFSGYGVTADHMTFSMCRTPNQSNWDRYDLKDSDYTTSFAVGEDASFLVKMSTQYGVSNDTVTTTFVIRDANNTLVSTNARNISWEQMWYQRYCELDIPEMPADAGTYYIDVYFNGMYVTTQQFTIA